MSQIRAICNLSDEELEARREQLREGLLPRVRAREELSDGLALLFAAAPALRAELDAFVELERECCPGLRFAVSESAAGLRLEIGGIDPRAPLFSEVAEADEPAEPVRRGWRRVLRSAGLGAAGSFVLFCVVPIGLAAVVGATPLALLDDPRIVGTGAIALALVFWRRERRREALRAERARAEGCGC